MHSKTLQSALCQSTNQFEIEYWLYQTPEQTTSIDIYRISKSSH